mmetsp:Transcript_16937/g.34224  ORF Transcript_16937/g.34224 Transcript_16937/m.34224 type:complete len:215 (+) Transcript_16937:295-939(+)
MRWHGVDRHDALKLAVQIEVIDLCADLNHSRHSPLALAAATAVTLTPVTTASSSDAGSSSSLCAPSLSSSSEYSSAICSLVGKPAPSTPSWLSPRGMIQLDRFSRRTTCHVMCASVPIRLPRCSTSSGNGFLKDGCAFSLKLTFTHLRVPSLSMPSASIMYGLRFLSVSMRTAGPVPNPAAARFSGLSLSKLSTSSIASIHSCLYSFTLFSGSS